MKIKHTILIISFIQFFSNVIAQNNTGFRNYKEEEIKRWKFGLSYAWVETDQKPLYVFDGFGGWKGTNIPIPQTFNFERRWNPHFRLNLGLSFAGYQPIYVFRYNYTDLQNEGVIAVNDSTFITDDGSSQSKSGKFVSYGNKDKYFGVDLNFLYNFRAFKHWWNLKPTWSLKNLHKEKMYFDGYFLAGLGVYNPIEIPTLNTGVGGDFWITYRWGINFQTQAKWSMNADDRFHMHHQVGVIFHVDQGNDAGGLGALRRRNKKRKKVRKAIIPEKRENYSDDYDESSDDDFDDFTE